MLFHSLAFFLFFPTVVALFFATPARHRWALLLAASYYFYAAWKPEYLVLIVASTLVDYLVALRMPGASLRRRKGLLLVSLAVNLGVLFAFKYANFFGASVQAAFRAANVMLAVPRLDVLLPVGISFYTFQTLSYSIDVYRGEREPERHLGRFALYVSFFPQLVAGPIERSTRLLPQLERLNARFDPKRVQQGLALIVWGLFKKAVIADRAAVFVDAIYADPERYGGPTLIVATYLFAFQIYGDFSGYSDIAIGSAKVLGVDLMDNFDRPYAARSIPGFWHRWHISLSTWFRDYVYIPLGGKRVALRRWVLNVMAVFVLSGLWHGANWTFVLWGAFHGALLLVTRAGMRLWKAATRGLSDDARGVLATALGVPLTFHLVCFGWMMFRADDLGHLMQLIGRLPELTASSWLDDLTLIGPAPRAALEVDLAVLAASVAMLEIGEWHRRRAEPWSLPMTLRWSAWGLLTSWLLLTAMQTHSPFIYFQF